MHKYIIYRLKKKIISALYFSIAFNCDAQNIVNGINLETEVSGTVSSGSFAPLWLSSNKHGKVSPFDNSAYERVCIFRPIETDSTREWKRGYGIDLMLNQHANYVYFIHQAFIEFAYKQLILSLGAKEREIELKNNELTSGGLSAGLNAQPIPQARIDIKYFNFPFTNGWWKWKTRFSFGITTDGRWQEDFSNQQTRYTTCTLYHEKALYWKFGKETATKCPLTFEIGLQTFTQFGGTAYNVDYREHIGGKQTISMPENSKAFWQAIFGGGRDATDFTESNNSGNILGSYNMRLAWHGHTTNNNTWEIGAYFERYFEDQSMLTVQYGIQDHLIGLDATFPKNRIISSTVIEHMSTRNQSGAVYHDCTTTIPDKMNGRDNYYNHNIYSGWQHWGMAIGNPLITSPIFNQDRIIYFHNNRVKAWHIGICGNPTSELHWRLFLTFTQNWGTYGAPFKDVIKQQYYLAEIGYQPNKMKGWSGKLALGFDYGGILGKSFGAQLTIHKSFILTK